MLIAAAVALWYLFGNSKPEEFSPGTAVQLYPTHAKKYADPKKYHKSYEELGVSSLGPLAPAHVLKTQNIKSIDPCFDEFESPFSLDSLESHMQANQPSNGINTNIPF